LERLWEVATAIEMLSPRYVRPLVDVVKVILGMLLVHRSPECLNRVAGATGGEDVSRAPDVTKSDSINAH